MSIFFSQWHFETKYSQVLTICLLSWLDSNVNSLLF